jgi:hypothetical protein
MRRRVLVLGMGLVVLPAVDAWAGHPQARQGFWIGFGAGYGSASVGCDDCETEDREGSITGYFKLGGTLSDRVLLGVESNAWVKNEEGGDLTLANVSGVVYFYPQPSSGFFLKAGVGLSYLDISVREDSFSSSLDKTGFGFLAGAGYDLRVGRNISITPSVNYYYGKPGDVAFQGEVLLGSFHHNVFDFVIGVTFH